MLPDVTLPDSVQALIVVIAFFTPGFIAGRVFELCFPRGEVTERVRLLEYVTLSSVNYAFWSWLIVVRWQWWQGHPVVVGVVVVGVLFLSPVVLGFGMAVGTEKQWFQCVARKLGVKAPRFLGTAWREFFRKDRRRWVIIRLRSGIMVYGFLWLGLVRGRRTAPA